jgi:glycosyltransferase involved in cell wall biosynthesis
MKRVLIATPCLDQKVDAYFVHSLCESIKLGLKHDLDIKCVFLANESILPMARNELFNLAYHDNYDIMVFIDDDELWEPDALIEILLSEKDVVAIPVVNKGDKKIEFNILYDKINLDTDGFFEIKSSGTGFLKLSRKVVVDLYESNTELVFRNKKLRNICEYTYLNGSFVGEDITLCRKIKELGYKIWVNPKFTVHHIGNKMYKGNFIEKINEQSNTIL